MTTIATQAWFEEGHWPVRSKDEISSHHFEDLRKKMFCLRNFSCGRDSDWLSDGIKRFGYASGSGALIGEIDSPSGKDDIVIGHIVCAWAGELWTNKIEIAASLYYNATAPSVTLPPYEFKRPVRVIYDGDYYQAAKRHTASASFEEDLAAGNWELIDESDIPRIKLWNTSTGQYEDTASAWYTPESWAAATDYPLYEWVYENTTWHLTASIDNFRFENHRYHDFDALTKRKAYFYREIDNAYSGIIEYVVPVADIYPKQLSAPENNKAIKYTDTGKMRWIYNDKVSFAKNIITNTSTIGARLLGKVVRPSSSTAAGWLVIADDDFYPENTLISQYANGLNLRAEHFTDRDYVVGYNPKADGEDYQTWIEIVMDSGNFHRGFDSTYQANWEALNDTLDWEDFTSGSADRKFPAMTDMLWGENESAFELAKKIEGTYDWCWSNCKWEPADYQIIRANGVEWVGGSWVPITSVDFPSPAGTWRRTWKNTLGRINNGWIRAVEKGDPRTGNDFAEFDNPRTFDVSDGLGGRMDYTSFWPDGTFAAAAPDISEFTNWTATKTDVSGNVFYVSGDYTDKIKPGWRIHVGTGTAIADYLDVDVLSVRYDSDSDRTYVKVIQDDHLSGNDTVCGDERVSARHDPIGFDEDQHPIYELTADLINELYNTLLTTDTQAKSLTLTVKAATVGIARPSSFFKSIQGLFDFVKGKESGIYQNPDDWVYDKERTIDGISYHYAGIEANLGAALYGSEWGLYGGVFMPFGASITYLWREYAIAAHALSKHLQNAKSTTVNFIWKSVPSTGPHTIQKCGNMYSTMHTPPETAKQSRYPITVPVSDIDDPNWIRVRPERYAKPFSIAQPDSWPYTNVVRVEGNCYFYQDNFSDHVFITIDFNKIPYSVMRRTDTEDRDYWGHIERNIDPRVSDTTPPIPNPAVWQDKPKAEFVHFPNGDFGTLEKRLFGKSIAGSHPAEGEFELVSPRPSATGEYDGETDVYQNGSYYLWYGALSYTKAIYISTTLGDSTPNSGYITATIPSGYDLTPEDFQGRYSSYSDTLEITYDYGRSEPEVQSIASSVITLDDASGFSAGSVVEVVTDDDGALPIGLSADTCYIIETVDGNDITLAKLAHGELESVTVGSSFTSGVFIKFCPYFALNITAKIIRGTDVDDMSLPLKYKMVGIDSTDAFDSDWQTSVTFQLRDSVFHYAESLWLDNEPLIDSEAIDTQGSEVVLPFVMPEGWAEEGDYVCLLGTGIEAERTHPMLIAEINTEDDTITLIWELTHTNFTTDSSKHFLYRPLVDGYGETQWEDEPAKAYEYKPKAKDNALALSHNTEDNETTLAHAVQAGIIEPTEYPPNIVFENLGD